MTTFFKIYSEAGIIKKTAFNFAIFAVVAAFFYFFLRKLDLVDYCYEQGVFGFTNFLLRGSKFILGLFGFDADIYGKMIIDINGYMALVLDRGCLGRDLMMAFVGFIVVLPSKSLKYKIRFLFVGLLIIIVFNMMRIAGLLAVSRISHDVMNFHHAYTFKYSIYTLVFLLWVYYFKENFAGITNNTKSED